MKPLTVGYKNKTTSSDMLYGNVSLFGVVAAHLHPECTGYPLPPQTQ